MVTGVHEVFGAIENRSVVVDATTYATKGFRSRST